MRERIQKAVLHSAVEPTEAQKKRFEAFFRRNVFAYPYKEYPVCCVGSVAYHYSGLLREVADTLSVNLGPVLSSPGEALAHYHAERMSE